MNRRAFAPEAAAPRRRRSLATTAILSAIAVFIGITGAGVTSALLTSTATQPGATITAGTAGIRIDGDTTSVLGSRALSPAAPAVWAFTLTNTGDAPLAPSGSIAVTAGGPAYSAAAQARVAPVANAAACTAALGGTPAPLNGYVVPAMSALAVGQTQWYCLVVSLPSGTSSAGSGLPLSFTMTVSATQSAT